MNDTITATDQSLPTPKKGGAGAVLVGGLALFLGFIAFLPFLGLASLPALALAVPGLILAIRAHRTAVVVLHLLAVVVGLWNAATSPTVHMAVGLSVLTATKSSASPSASPVRKEGAFKPTGDQLLGYYPQAPKPRPPAGISEASQRSSGPLSITERPKLAATEPSDPRPNSSSAPEQGGSSPPEPAVSAAKVTPESVAPSEPLSVSPSGPAVLEAETPPPPPPLPPAREVEEVKALPLVEAPPKVQAAPKPMAQKKAVATRKEAKAEEKSKMASTNAPTCRAGEMDVLGEKKLVLLCRNDAGKWIVQGELRQ
jgi:hypothetical protein